MQPSTEGAARFWLAANVYVCRIRDAVVFADLERDQYTALSGRQMLALSAVVEGWPSEHGTVEGELIADTYAEKIAAQLADRQLLTRNQSRGKSVTKLSLEISEDPIFVGMDLVRSRAIRVVDIINFLLAWRWAARAQRRPLPLVVDEVKARKQSGSAAREVDRDMVAALVCLFRRLRRYAFSARGRCLFHSLMLVNFLSRYGVFPTWVMGVRTHPWGAHSWVQQGPLVLDSDPGENAEYAPILAV